MTTGGNCGASGHQKLIYRPEMCGVLRPSNFSVQAGWKSKEDL